MTTVTYINLTILKDIISGVEESDPEHNEVWGLIGRAYKQQYVDAKGSQISL